MRIPGLCSDCRRASSAAARGFAMHGEPVTIEGTEMLAGALQHEPDHLDGIVCVERLDRETRKAAMRAIREAEWFGAGDTGSPLTVPTIKVSPHPTRGLGL